MEDIEKDTKENSCIDNCVLNDGDNESDFSEKIFHTPLGSTQCLLPAKLSLKTKFFYSLGHIYNDLVGSIWFSYTLLFFKFQFTGSLAGSLILLGQITDAIASPFVGFESDKSAYMYLCKKFGQRKTWHLLGTIMCTISVPFIYNECFHCQQSSEWSRFFYYGILVMLFQTGWAAVQVSHVSLIVNLTMDSNERISLNAFRQAATIGANICLYTITLFVIGFEDNNTIQQKDVVIFTRISMIVCVIGLIFTLLFYLFVNERKHQQVKTREIRQSIFFIEKKQYLKQSRGSQNVITFLANTNNRSTSSKNENNDTLSGDDVYWKYMSNNKEKIWYHWFKSLSFWKIIFIYTLARMFFNVTQVYIPLYLQDFLQLGKQNIAIIPFATYFAGLIFSFICKTLSSRFGSRITLLTGCVFGIITSVWIHFGTDVSYKTYQIYIVSAFLGISGTALIISSVSLSSDLIGRNTATGAFVFSSMSFFDKSINGIVIALFEKFKPEQNGDLLIGNNYYKNIMVALTGLPSIMIFIGLLTLIKTQYGKSRSNSSTSTSFIH